jgi:predicted nuclease of predicted toxin-antitoxin system
MRFLADESCDFAVVRALRSAAHDVSAVSEFQRRSIDRDLIEAAFADRRILLTEDKDFGWLVFVAHATCPGVILIRFPASARQILASSIKRLVDDFGPRLEGAFVVLRPGFVRISTKLPE